MIDAVVGSVKDSEIVVEYPSLAKKGVGIWSWHWPTDRIKEKATDGLPRSDVVHLGVGHHPAAVDEPAPAEPRPHRGVDGGADAPLEAGPAGGAKFDAEKPPLDLLDATALLEVGRVLGFGAKKYAAHNWRKGISRERLLAAALRHLFASMSGERKDPETGLSHLAHAMCCLMFALHFELTNSEVPDTRFQKPQP